MEANVGEAQIEELLGWLSGELRPCVEVVDHIGGAVQQYGTTIEVSPRLPSIRRAEVMGQPPDGVWAVNVSLEPAADGDWPTLGRLAARWGEWVEPPAHGGSMRRKVVFTVAARDTFLSRVVAEVEGEVGEAARPARLIVSVQDMAKLA